MKDYQGNEQRKHKSMRVVARYLNLNNLHRRSTSILHQKILNLHPSQLIIHHPRQVPHLLLTQPKQPHHAVDQFLRMAALVEDLLVD